MCNYQVTPDTNPMFIVYNLVFNAPRGKVINVDGISSELATFDKFLAPEEISSMLDRWYRDGMLDMCGESRYVRAA